MCPSRDAAVARRLREAGGVLIGKTNTPEFGNRATTNFGLFPATHNPWDLSRTAGGSSGGSAAAVAACSLPDRRGLRRRRLDPHPVELLRRGRHQAVARPRLERAQLEPAGRAHHPRADRPHRARRRAHARRHGRRRARRPVQRAAAVDLVPRGDRDGARQARIGMLVTSDKRIDPEVVAAVRADGRSARVARPPASRRPTST